MKLATFLFAILFLCAGCGMFQKDIVTDQEFVAQDGTIVPAGGTVYINEAGLSTANAIDPVTQKPNKTAREIDLAKKEAAEKAATEATKHIPWGLGGLAAGLIGIVGGLGTKEILKRNAATRAALGVPPPKTT